MNEIIQYLSFFVLFTSLSTILSKSIHVVANGKNCILFHGQVVFSSTKKDRNGKDLTEAVLRRGGKNTQKAFMTDNHDGVITQTFWGEKSSGP